MIFYLYDDFEKEYHCLSCGHCECKPRIIGFNGGVVLLVHNKLADPENNWTEDEIKDAQQEIIDHFNE
jgi:hypothetical protein